MSITGVPLSEYAKRRAKVLTSLKGAVGVVFAGDGSPPLKGAWVPDWNFFYLTGIKDEAGAAVFFDPKHEDPRRRCILLLRPLNPEMEDWDGFRDRISKDLKDKTGFEAVMRTTMLPRLFKIAARRSKRLACLHPFASYNAPVSADLALFNKVTQRIPGTHIEDKTDLFPSMRAIKSAAELKQMKSAIAATANGFAALAASLKPDVGERDMQRVLENGFHDAGGDDTAYDSIVGSGRNGAILHYMANDGLCNKGDLLVVDAGASVNGYASDITRTFPVSGKFTKEQRDLYTVILKALEASIKVVKPGVKMSDVDAAARKIIDKAGYGDTFIHGIGHQLGIEVHDVTPDGPLKPGMVITVEPGIYFADRGIGIRIEDDVLVTAKGSRNLSAMIPKSIEDVEAAMRVRAAKR